jgi:photosystem II stability/assembly factor-like uncharacterized protein
MRVVPKVFAFACLLAGLCTDPYAEAQQYAPDLYSEMRWRCIGPFRAGRTVAISGVPQQPNVFYMAAVNGGVWKTTDFGNTWFPIFDDQTSGSVGALALAPSDPNVIYVGSGEGLQRPDLAVGDGLYKSSDAGQTWTHLGLRDAQQITAIVVDPKNPDRVLIAVEGHPYGPNVERGVFRSLDGGKTFDKVLYKDENTGAADLVMDPANPQVVYAALWAARVAPWEIRSGESFVIPGSGLYKSVDGGTTWRQITNGLPGSGEVIGRIGIAIAPGNPKRVYLTLEAQKEPGIYRSDDAGESWRRVNEDHRIGGRGPGAMGIAVSPDNADTIYVANTALWKSTDAGKTFLGFKGAPGGDDYQRIWINPNNAQTIALSSDQGAVISVNGGQTWSTWYNQPTAQFYHVTTDTRFPYWVYGAQQESGAAATQSRSDTGEITFREWSLPGIEEYGYIAVDPRDSNILYGGRITRTNQQLKEYADVAPEPIRTGQYRYNRSLPIVFAPFDPATLYFAANVVFKTTDGGRSWQVISPDLTREAPEIPANLGAFSAGDPEKGKHRGTVYALAPSFKEADTIWAGTDDGQIQLTRDAGKTWKNVTPPQLSSWSKISILEASHFDAATVYAAVNRFRLDDLTPHVYRTRDFGVSWQEIVAGLPGNAPINVVREDPLRKGLLFAGSEAAVFVSFNDGDSWQSLQLNLPHTSMRDLAIHGDDLIVATHGRSFWILDDITPLRQLEPEVVKSQAFLFKPQDAVRWRSNRNPDTPLPPEIPAGKNPPDGAILDYYLSSAARDPVIIEIFDEHGSSVRRYSSADAPLNMEKLSSEHPIPMYWVRPAEIPSAGQGMHRFVWDLHGAPPKTLNSEFPISAIVHNTPLLPRGVRALPGAYTVKLTVDGKESTQSLTLRMDPRIKTSAADLQQQAKLESGAISGMNQDYAILGEIQSVREQVKETMPKVAGKLAESLESVDQQCGGLAGGTVSTFFGTPSAGKQRESLSSLNQHFGQLLAIADSADAAPTSQAAQVFADLSEQLQELSARWLELKSTTLARVNRDLAKAKLPVLDPAKPTSQLLGGAGDSDDEP